MADQPVTDGQTGSESSFQPSDRHHLQAAEGWLELGNPLEANEEVEKITPQLAPDPP